MSMHVNDLTVSDIDLIICLRTLEYLIFTQSISGFSSSQVLPSFHASLSSGTSVGARSSRFRRLAGGGLLNKSKPALSPCEDLMVPHTLGGLSRR